MDSITHDVYWKRKVHRIYRVNLSSRVRLTGELVAFRAVWCGNSSRMLWIELAVCHVCTATVCIATDCTATVGQNKLIIRMSSKIDCQLRQVCLSIFLSAWNNWATAGRNCVKCYIYIYEDFSKICLKSNRDCIMKRKPVMYTKMYSWCSYCNIWL